MKLFHMIGKRSGTGNPYVTYLTLFVTLVPIKSKLIMKGLLFFYASRLQSFIKLVFVHLHGELMALLQVLVDTHEIKFDLSIAKKAGV